ncbi:unnamed protein product, partial [Ectocarpus sp. 12 AP-2014]
HLRNAYFEIPAPVERTEQRDLWVTALGAPPAAELPRVAAGARSTVSKAEVEGRVGLGGRQEAIVGGMRGGVVGANEATAILCDHYSRGSGRKCRRLGAACGTSGDGRAGSHRAK